MNVSWELMELVEEKRKLEQAKKTLWQGFTSILGLGFTFVGGSILCMLTIPQTPHWVIYLIIGGIVFIALFGFLLYSAYKEAKKKLEDCLAKIRAKKEQG